MRLRESMRFISVLVALTLPLAACAGGEEDTASPAAPDAGSETAASPTPSTPGEGMAAGCEENGWIDPANREDDRPIARCEPGSPEPQPLDEEVSIKLAAATFNAEYAAPIAYAQHLGEFEKENLDVELVAMPFAEALQLVGTGEMDAMWSSPTAGFVNAVEGGFELRWVSGNFFPSEESKTGVWMKKTDEADSVEDLDDVVFGSWGGEGSTTPAYPLADDLEAVGLTPQDLNYQQLPAADVVTALRNGAIGAAWLVDPWWTEFDNDPGFVFLGGQPYGEPLGGMIYGPSLREDNPEAGVALMRAIIRTINTYFDGQYKDDPEFVAELAEVLEVPEESLLASPESVYDWEIREGTVAGVQEQYIAADLLPVDEPLPEDELVDRSFYERAVGRSQE